jgi:PAS domain S-box-containing protein
MAKTIPTLSKAKLKSADEQSEFAENIFDTVREPLIVLDKDLRVVKASRSFYDFFKVSSDETIGTLIYNLGNGQWNIPKLRELLETIIPEKTTFDNYEVEHDFSTIGKRIMLLNARKIQRGLGKEQIILLAIEDITERKLAEEALTISETRYHGLFESAKDGILILDSETGKIVDVNPVLINMLGYSKEQFINKTIWEMGIFKDIVANQDNYLEFQQKGYNRYEHLPLETKDGRQIDIEFVSNVNIAHQQKVTQCNIRDITERKRAEETLQENEKRYRELFDNAPIGYHELDLQGRITRINRTELNMLGYTEKEMIGQFIWKFVGDEDMSQQRVLGKLKGILLPAIDAERVYRRKDLTTFTVLSEERVLRDATYNITGIRTNIQDITERKRAQEEIIFQKNRFAQLFENSPIAIALLDDQDKIILINESFSNLFGYYLEEIKGKSLNDFIVPHELKKEATRYSDQIREGGQINKESYRRRKDGTLVYVQIVGVPIIINEKTVDIYGMYVDLTRRKISEQELIKAKEKAEEMSRLKSNFLANMSHELRTPLNGILGYADILTSQLIEPEQIKMMQGIYQSGKRLSETLNFILDLSAIETDEVEVIAKDLAVVPLAKNSINSFANEAAKKNLQLETIIKGKNIYAHLDKHLFTRILYNLLDNALKFTNKGKIIVEIGKELIAEKEWLYIKVKDTGIGIAYDKIDLIWDEFRQVSEGITRRYEGAGLGLTISKKAVELMQGIISVESELGIGSVFTVKFPAVNAISQNEELITEKQAAVIQPEKETAKPATLPLVLYVEDDFVNRDIVKLYLKNTCIVETAEDGETALQLAAKKMYEVILIDINLGAEMNGIEVVKELLKMPQYAGTPIITVTAYVTGKDRAEFIKGGGTHYLSKPFQKREILDLVKSVLKNN